MLCLILLFSAAKQRALFIIKQKIYIIYKKMEADDNSVFVCSV